MSGTWSLIDRYFYDSEHNGVDWKAIHDKYRPEVDDCDSPAEVKGSTGMKSMVPAIVVLRPSIGKRVRVRMPDSPAIRW